MKKIGSAKKAKHEANKYVFVPVLTDEIKWREPTGKVHALREAYKILLDRRLAHTSIRKPNVNEWKVWVKEV